MTHNCDYCNLETQRHVFCCASHKVMWHRDRRELGDVAQSAEHGVVNAEVGGSKPPVPAREKWKPYVPFYDKKGE